MPNTQTQSLNDFFDDARGERLERFQLTVVQPRHLVHDGVGDTPVSDDERAILGLGDSGRVRMMPRSQGSATSGLSFAALQEWEGFVLRIGQDAFLARLRDVTFDGDHEDEEVELPLSDVSDSDRDLLREGALFRWVIGYQKSRAGTTRRLSQVVFRRLPAWTRADFAVAKAKTKELVGLLTAS